MENKIILRKNQKPKVDYFAIILCVITISLLVFQVMADRHISNANKKFIEGAKAKRIALQVKERKALMEKELEAKRLKKLEEEENFRTSIEDKTKRQEGNRLEKVGQKGMDYQQKLAIYNQAQSPKRK